MNLGLIEQALRIHFPGARIQVKADAVSLDWLGIPDIFTIRGYSTESDARAVHEIVLCAEDWLSRKLLEDYRSEESAAQKFIEDAKRWQDLVMS